LIRAVAPGSSTYKRTEESRTERSDDQGAFFRESQVKMMLLLSFIGALIALIDLTAAQRVFAHVIVRRNYIPGFFSMRSQV